MTPETKLPDTEFNNCEPGSDYWEAGGDFRIKHLYREDDDMPISSHYKGKGRKVMREMKKRYGKKAGQRIFYATENKQKKKAKKGQTGRRETMRYSIA